MTLRWPRVTRVIFRNGLIAEFAVGLFEQATRHRSWVKYRYRAVENFCIRAINV